MAIVSSLANKIIVSPNKSKRTAKIDTISIHVVDGNATVEGLGNTFANPARQASSNYGIASDGRIGCYVPEEYRSWCTSNSANDNRAITIEVSNDGGKNTGYHVSDKALSSLIILLVDVCKRNGIKQLKWKSNKALIGKIDQQNMTVHRWFKNKACPGDYLYNLHGWIACEVNKQLGTGYTPTQSSWMWQGVDWQNVFDPVFYLDKYRKEMELWCANLKTSIENKDAIFQHFVLCGMNEKRQAKADFNVVAYRNRYTDLQKAFGDNWQSYYWHYCLCGKKEGRKAT